MHPEIDKMVKMAQSRGSLTVAQRDMIINKAKELGDDTMEVEFILSGLSTNDAPSAQSAASNAPDQMQQQNNYQQPQQANVYQQQARTNIQQQQQTASGATMADTSNKTSLILGIGSTALGVVGFASIAIAVLGLAAGIFGLIRSKGEKKQFAEAQGSVVKNPFQAAFVLSIIGISISGLSFLVGLAE